MKKIIFIALSALTLNAEPIEQHLEYWEDVTSKKNGVVTFFDEIRKGTKWIEVQSSYARQQKSLDEVEKRKEVLFFKLRKSVSECLGNQVYDNLKSLENLFKLEKALYEAGGYDNKILGLSVSKVAGVKMLKLAIEDSDLLPEISSLLIERNDNVLFRPEQSLVIFSQEDEQFIGSETILKEVMAGEETKKKLVYGHVGLIAALSEQLPNALKRKENFMSDGIYEVPSVYHLEAFESSIESYLRSALPCALSFLSKGGVLGDLDPNKVTKINDVMGDEKWKYKFPYMQISYPSSRQLVSAHKEINNYDSIRKQLYLE